MVTGWKWHTSATNAPEGLEGSEWSGTAKNGPVLDMILTTQGSSSFLRALLSSTKESGDGSRKGHLPRGHFSRNGRPDPRRRAIRLGIFESTPSILSATVK